MRRRQRTFAETLARSLTVSGVLYALVTAYVLPVAMVSQGGDGRLGVRPDSGAGGQVSGQPSWRRVHADRFPDCVDIARWAAGDVPSTVVVVQRDGDLRRMSFDEAYRRATSPSAADDVWTIGACD